MRLCTVLLDLFWHPLSLVFYETLRKDCAPHRFLLLFFAQVHHPALDIESDIPKQE